jgi:hypothetical protein
MIVMKSKFYPILILLLFIKLSEAQSQLTSIDARLDKDTIMIGEQTGLTLRVVLEKSIKVSFPVFSDTLSDKVEIISVGKIDSVLSGQELVLSQYLVITSFDSGQTVIPSFPFAMEFEEVQDTLYTISKRLNVLTPEIDPESDFKDIKAPINTPLSFREILPYAGLGLIAIAIVSILLLYIRKALRKEKIPKEELVHIPPYVIALEKLNSMVEDKSWQIWPIKEFYTKLSGIVRIYIENQFNIPALESTTPEILRSFELVYGRNDGIKTRLVELLELSDLVKFAKEAPSPDVNRNNIEKAIQFVDLTKPMIGTEKQAEKVLKVE